MAHVRVMLVRLISEMITAREKLQKLDREIAAVDAKLWAWGGLASQFIPKALKNKRAELDEQRKAVRLERKKYGRQN